MQEKDTPEARAVARGQEYAFPGKVSEFIHTVTRHELHEDGTVKLHEETAGFQDRYHQGFTKREVIAKDCLAAILSMSTPPNVQDAIGMEKYLYYPAMLAVKQADALLIELSKGVTR